MTIVLPNEASPYRLPGTVVPRHYDLHLVVDLEAATFTGTVVARVHLEQAAADIVLNAAELEISEAWVLLGESQRIDAAVTLDPETERATLALVAPVAGGEAVVHIRFRGILNDKLRGFYRTTFTDAAGIGQVAGSTQFEATHARRAFPCWDEPSFKAVFSITLDVPAGQAAFSNASEISRETLASGQQRFRFADTMVMSTYLVAFVVGPFDATEPIQVAAGPATPQGRELIPLRVVYPRGQNPALAQYGLECGRFGLEYFANYYDIGYPGDKVDLVAVPDFAFGAMENLGCITFREVLLLVDPETTTQPELQRVADVIFHELAHMWFGDLVTMKWWNGLWLNEAFATFMEMRCTDAFRPEWQRWVDFGLSRTMAFDTDSLASTRPIEFEVISPEDAEGMFVILTYEKGAAVLRMIEQYLGEDQFRAGVRAYLSEFSYGNTETNDLWDAVETATGQPVRSVADSWIFQGGYPLVSASLSAGGNALHLAQEPFRYTEAPIPTARRGAAEGDEEQNEALASIWQIPVLARVQRAGGQELLRVLLDAPSATIPLQQPADSVLLVNAGGHGFYRVRYAPSLLAALTARPQDHLSSIERYALLDDAYAAMLAGATTSAEVVALCRRLADDDDLSVWQRIAGIFGALSRLVADADRPHFEATVRSIAGPALDIAGWEPAEGESERQRELRATLFSLLGITGNDPRVQERATALHDRPSTKAVDPSLLSAAINVLAAHGDAARYDEFLAASESSSTPQEQRRYLYALADFRDDGLTDRTLDRCTSGAIRSQDAPFVIGRALGNRVQGPRVWRHIVTNWAELNERFPSNTIVRMVSSVATFTDPAMASEINGFFAEHPVPQGTKTLTQNLEKLAVNVALAEREGPAVAAALR